MKEELNTKLVEILTSIQTAAGKASDFALEQLPDIAQSYVLYGRVQSLVGIATGIAFLLCGLWILKKVRLYIKSFVNFYETEPLVVMGGGLIGAGLSLIGAVYAESHLNNAVLVWLAPKVWLLKELASLIK